MNSNKMRVNVSSVRTVLLIEWEIYYLIEIRCHYIQCLCVRKTPL